MELLFSYVINLFRAEVAKSDYFIWREAHLKQTVTFLIVIWQLFSTWQLIHKRFCLTFLNIIGSFHLCSLETVFPVVISSLFKGRFLPYSFFKTVFEQCRSALRKIKLVFSICCDKYSGISIKTSPSYDSFPTRNFRFHKRKSWKDLKS